jgi:hypothetical protein
MNQALQLSSLVWNYAIDVESGDANEKMTKELISLIQSNRHVGKDEAKDILDIFVTQKKEMFPPEVQVKGSPMMFMREKTPHLIAPFNYKKLHLSETA